MKHRYQLSRIKVVSTLSDKIELLKDLSFVLAIVINLLLVLAYGVVTPTASLIIPDAASNDTQFLNPRWLRPLRAEHFALLAV
jgi:hypothetical protein